MEWLQNMLGGENSSAIQLVLITLLLMIGLILIVWLFRRIAGSPSRRAGRNRVPRLSITDSTMVDDKRYLVLVRRDNIEHLVLIGGPTDVVVETGIMRVKPAEQPVTQKSAATLAQQNSDRENIDTLLAYNESSTKGPAPEKHQAASPEPNSSLQSAAPVAATAAVVETLEVSPEPEDTQPVASVAEPEISGDELEEALAEIATISEESIESENTEQQPSFESAQAESPAPVEEPQAYVETISQDETAPAVDVPEPVEPSLEESISAQLDDALSGEAFAPEGGETIVEAEPAKAANADDEMQRLLDELAGESKKSS